MHFNFESESSVQRLLREIADLCEHASLTGSLEGGSQRVAKRYNSILSQLEQQGDLPDGLFDPLGEHVSYGEIGVEARMLHAFVAKGKDKRKPKDEPDLDILVRLAPFVKREDMGELIRSHVGSGEVSLDLLVRLAPFIPSEDVHRIVQENLRAHIQPPTPPEPPVPPTPPEPPRPPETNVVPIWNDPSADVRKVADALRRSDLPDELRDQLVNHLQQLMNRG